jgi:hypothetical protein
MLWPRSGFLGCVAHDETVRSFGRNDGSLGFAGENTLRSILGLKRKDGLALAYDFSGVQKFIGE